MSISMPRALRPAPKPSGSELLREAISAHETKMAATADTRALVLTRQVLAILGRAVDRIQYLPRPDREPVAIVSRLQFRWIPERHNSMEPGWLVVRTDPDGWDQVDSIEDLGALAKRTSLALADAVWP